MFSVPKFNTNTNANTGNQQRIRTAPIFKNK